MSHSTLRDDEMAAREMTARTRVKPGLFQGWRSNRDARDGKVPLGITLLVTMAVSCALWVGLFFAIRALLR